MIVFGLIFVLSIASTVYGNNCDEEAKHAFSIMFCDEATHCSNETAEEYLDNFRHCFIKQSEKAKEIIEAGNKLDPDQCVEEVNKRVCEILDELTEHPAQFSECVKDIQQMPVLLNSCMSTDSNQSHSLEKIARVVCANSDDVKCDSDGAKEAFNIGKSCLTDNIPELNDIRKNNPDIDQCKMAAKEDVVQVMQKQEKASVIAECYTKHEEILNKYDDLDKVCSGF